MYCTVLWTCCPVTDGNILCCVATPSRDALIGLTALTALTAFDTTYAIPTLACIAVHRCASRRSSGVVHLHRQYPNPGLIVLLPAARRYQGGISRSVRSNGCAEVLFVVEERYSPSPRGISCAPLTLRTRVHACWSWILELDTGYCILKTSVDALRTHVQAQRKRIPLSSDIHPTIAHHHHSPSDNTFVASRCSTLMVLVLGTSQLTHTQTHTPMN